VLVADCDIAGAGVDCDIAGAEDDFGIADPYVDYKRHNFLDPEGGDVAFTLSLLNKDVTLGLTLADDHNLNLPQAHTVGRILDHAMKSGLGQHDMAAVLELLRTDPQRDSQLH
jgi:3-hydroxyisobutyrate dehydrogenase